MYYSTVIYVTIQRYALQYSEVSDIYRSAVICIRGVVVYCKQHSDIYRRGVMNYNTVIHITIQ